MDEKEVNCGVCFRKLKPSEGRYNTSHGSICTDCYSPSLLSKKAAEGELISKSNSQRSVSS